MFVRFGFALPSLLCTIVLSASVALPALQAQNTDDWLPPVIDVHVHSMTQYFRRSQIEALGHASIDTTVLIAQSEPEARTIPSLSTGPPAILN